MLNFLTKIPFKEILYLIEDKKIFFFIIFLSFINILFEIISLGSIVPIVLSISNFELFLDLLPLKIESFLGKYDKNSITIFLLISSLIFFFLRSFLAILVNWKINNICYEQLKKLRWNIFKYLLNRNYLSFIKFDQSESINTLVITTHEFIELAFKPLVKIISELFLVTILVIFIFLNFSFYFLIIISIFFLIFIIFFSGLKKKIEKYGKLSDQNNAKFIEYINYNFDGKLEIENLNLKNKFYDKTKYFLNILIKSKKKSVLFEIIPRYVIELVAFIIIISFLFFELFFVQNNLIFVNFTVISVLTLRLIPSLNIIFISFSQIQFSKYHTYKLLNFFTLFGKKDKIKVNNDFNLKNLSTNLNSKINKVTFQNINFNYETVSIFKNFNLEIIINGIVVLYGKSGSGKSTLMKLLLGILNPQSGCILINDQQALDYNKIQNQIFYLKQNPFLISDTVLNNITLFSEYTELEYQRIKNIIYKLNLVNSLESTELFLNTILKNNGKNLSGGQLQRIIIARAIFFNRKIIILDEPTSNLDKDNVNTFIKLIKKLSLEFTFIIITHDESFHSISNQIIKID